MKLTYLLVLLFTSISHLLGQQSPPDIFLLNHPNIVAVGTNEKSAYVHPANLYNWLAEQKPTYIVQGQVSQCKINGMEIAISAPHVIHHPKWPEPLPSYIAFGPWIDSVDGREISFARITDKTKSGFTQEALEAKPPLFGKEATIIAACFQHQPVMNVVNLEVKGEKLELVGSEYLSSFAKLFENLHGSSFYSRLTKRAPTEYLLAMVIPEKFRDQVQGMSGGLVFQDGYPVGVFVACVRPDGVPPLAIIEPLLEPGKATLQKMK